MDGYIVDIHELLDDLGASSVVDVVVDLPPMEFGQSSFVPTGPAHAAVTLSYTGSGIVAYGTVEADVQTECARCLVPFVLHVTGEVEGFYTTPDRAASLADEQDWAPIAADDSVDLLPALDAAIRIELPLAPLHAEDCAGICPTCGQDLNAAACSCDSDTPPPGPFDALKTLLPPEKE